MRIMLQDVLCEAGYDVVTAADGEEAWTLIREEEAPYDLLIIDLLMPKMTGFDVLEKLRESGEEGRKVLVVTGIFKSGKEVQRLRDLGICGYITKTALVDEILFRVNQVFHQGQAETRRFPRALMSFPVNYMVNGEQYSNYSSNFSAGGVFIRTIDPAPAHKEIALNFKLSEIELNVDLRGRVVWTNEYETNRRKSSLPGMGVEFIDIDSSLRESLAAFIDKKLSAEPVWLKG